MGGQSLGAHMHVDNVRLPSWQAQIKGVKEWILAPPPECYYECSTFSVTVQTGDISEQMMHSNSNFKIYTNLVKNCIQLISVVLDTNKWYHKTIVMPGEISITIGAEYD